MIEQIFCFGFAAALLWLTFRLVHKEKYAFATFVCIAAIVSGLCGLTWFQGLMKTQIISIVSSTLKDYGNKLEDFQNTTTNIQWQLDSHQAELRVAQTNIASEQLTLSNEIARITDLQTQVTSAQNNVDKQWQTNGSVQTNLLAIQGRIEQEQQQIEDVRYLIDNLYGNTHQEAFNGDDTNSVAIVDFGDGTFEMFFRLRTAVVFKSVHGWRNGNEQQSLLPIQSQGNIAYSLFNSISLDELRKSRYTLEYVADNRATTPLVRTVEAHGKELFVNHLKTEIYYNATQP